MKTASAWGPPPGRHYSFLRRVAAIDIGARYDLAVLGCADGKFVLPAARRGLSVLAVDRDEVALYGGAKPGVSGDEIIPGLVRRLEQERLRDRVTVVSADFTRMRPAPCRAAWVSGAVQYSFNMPQSAAAVMAAVQQFVAVGGLLYVDYMLPFEEKYRGRPNCPDAEWWRNWACGLVEWHVLWNRVLPPVRDRAHIEYPVDHFHQWGHLLMRRIA